jgi:hypothetical protein
MKLAFIIKNENGIYWLYAINEKANDYKGIDGDKRLYVVKDMAKRWGYKLVSAKDFNDYYKISETIRMYDNRKKYNNGGNVLLAPNGKPSKLTPEQYRLVRTPEFISWFGDWINSPETASKVVDENGEPLVVYHGSENEFNVYGIDKVGKTDYGIAGRGFYFTSDKDISEAYSMKAYSEVIGFIHSVFLSVKEPKLVIDPIEIGIDLYFFKQSKESRDNIFKATDNLIKLGNDGVIWKKTNFAPPIKWEYVAFYPNQIKLADGTNTTFDGNNPDIRFDVGGNITYREYADTQFNEEEDRYLPSHYFNDFEIKKASKDNLPLIKIKDALEYRYWGNGVKVFDNDYLTADADMKAIQVASKYQKRGIGLELVTILKEMNPNHRFSSMTPQGFALMGKYYDTKIANNPNRRHKDGGNINNFKYTIGGL